MDHELRIDPSHSSQRLTAAELHGYLSAPAPGTWPRPLIRGLSPSHMLTLDEPFLGREELRTGGLL
jgi:hypothetical protein